MPAVRARRAVAAGLALGLLASVTACGTRLPDEAFETDATGTGTTVRGRPAADASSSAADTATGGDVATGQDGTGSAGPATGSGAARGTGASRGPNQASDVGVTPTAIRIGTIVAEQGVLGDAFAPAVWGLRSWVAHTNAQGGIAGRQIELFTCDDREDRSRTLECAKRLVERDQVFALVAVNTRSIGGASQYLDGQGIPVLGFPIGNAFNRFPHFYSAYGSLFPRDGKQVGFNGRLVFTSALFHPFKELGARKAAIFGYDIAESAQAVDLFKRGLELEGFEVTRYNVSFAAPSFDTAVADMQRNGVQLIVDAMDPGANIRLCDSMARRQFKPLAKLTQVPAFGESVRTSLNDACRPITYVFGFSRPYNTTSVPFIATFNAAMRRYQPGKQLHQWSLEAWVQGEAVRQALVALGPAPTRVGVEEFLERNEGIDIPGVLAMPLRWVHLPEAATATSGVVCFSIAKWDDGAAGGWTTPLGFPYCADGRIYTTATAEQGT